MPLTDEQLIERLCQGEADALTELYRRHARTLYVFFRHTSGLADPEDLVHDVFMRVVRSAHRFSPAKGTFRTWLLCIARNRAIDQLRHQRISQSISLDREIAQDGEGQRSSLGDTLPDGGVPADESCARESVIRAVRDCLGTLKNAEEKEAILLYYLAGRVYREIGETCGASISMVRKRIASAREKLKACLERKGITAFPP